MRRGLASVVIGGGTGGRGPTHRPGFVRLELPTPGIEGGSMQTLSSAGPDVGKRRRG